MATTAEEGVTTLPEPATLKNLVTDYPIDANFDANAFYSDNETNGWYPLLEKYVDTIMDECDKYVKLHEDASKTYNNRYQIITISLIVIPFISGVVSFLPFGQTFQKIAIGFLSLILVALGSFNKAMQFNELSGIHRIARDKFMKLNGTIAEQLFLPFAKRYNGVLFERWCRNTFFTIKELAPFPERRTNKRRRRHIMDDTPLRPTPDGNQVPPEVSGDEPPEAGDDIPLETPAEDNTQAIARYRDYLQDRRQRATFRG
jgi:hypothetical protein